MKGTSLNILSRISLCLALLAAGDGSAFAAPFFSAPIKATVVNSDTGRPLEGVMVVASWMSETSSIESHSPVSEGGGSRSLCRELVNLVTAVSGRDGVFQIPGWGPKGGCLIMQSEPTVMLYKPGFQPLQLSFPSRNSAVLFKSTSSWDGQTIKLVRTGAHGAIPDPQVQSLEDYMVPLMPLLQLSGRCFWDEGRPAYLLAMQEERRLKGYGYDKNGNDISDLMESWLKSAYKPPSKDKGWCYPPKGYIDGLTAEADKTPEEIRPTQFAAGSQEDAFERSNPEPWAMPAEDLPQGDDLAPGGAAEVAIIHHVNLQYPDKPYFARVYTSLPLDPKVISGFPRLSVGGWDNPVCGEFNAPTPEGHEPPFIYGAPPGLDKNGKVPGGYPVCYMLKTLGAPVDSTGPHAQGYPNDDFFTRRPTYDAATLTYVITEQMLYRQPGVKVPEYIEIEAPPGAHISTDLKPTANPRRWLLPGFTGEPQAPSVTPIPRSLSPLVAHQPNQPSLTSKFRLVVTMPRIAGRPASTQAVPQPYEGITSIHYGRTVQMIMAPAATTH